MISKDPELELAALLRIAKREPQFQWKGRMGETGNPLFRGFQSAEGPEPNGFDQPVFVRLNLEKNEGFSSGFPRLAKDLFQPFRAIIIDDMEADFLTGEQKEILFDFVTERGGSLILLGGQESFSAGGWAADERLSRLLPFRDSISSTMIRSGAPKPVKVSESGKRLGWNLSEVKKPAFISSNRQGMRKLATRNLIDFAEVEESGLLEIRVGKGKVFSWPVADTWRAQLADDTQRDWFAQFWSQFIRYAVTDVPTEVNAEVATHAMTSKRMGLYVKASVFDETFKPDDRAAVKVAVKSEGADEGKEFIVPLSLTESGVFKNEEITVSGQVATLQFEVTQGGESSLLSRMVVTNPLSDETAILEVDDANLRAIAERSGGGVFSWEELPKLLQQMKKQERMKVTETKEPIWQSVWWFFLIALMLLSEWWIRRKSLRLA